MEKEIGYLCNFFKRYLQRNGPVWSYFQSQMSEMKGKQNEIRLRELFHIFHNIENPSDWDKPGLLEAGKYLGSFYSVSRTISDDLKPVLFKAIFIESGDYIKLFRKGEKLLYGDREIAESCGKFVSAVLSRYKALVEHEKSQKKPKVPFSYLSKLLHFCRPDVFPIFDSLNASCWKVILDKDAQMDNRIFSEFNEDDSGLRYSSVCIFYQELWSEVLGEIKDEICKAAEKILEEFKELHFFTPLEALDKAFWLCSKECLAKELYA